jgi:hypothetical protein
LKNSKKLILIEAKFEGDFDEDQIVETQKYGESLIKLLGENIICSHVGPQRLSQFENQYMLHV